MGLESQVMKCALLRNMIFTLHAVDEGRTEEYKHHPRAQPRS